MSERDMMVCRSCNNEERASEGYPCSSCGTFICQICDNRGITLCKACRAKQNQPEPKNLPPQRSAAP